MLETCSLPFVMLYECNSCPYGLKFASFGSLERKSSRLEVKSGGILLAKTLITSSGCNQMKKKSRTVLCCLDVLNIWFSCYFFYILTKILISVFLPTPLFARKILQCKLFPVGLPKCTSIIWCKPYLNLRTISQHRPKGGNNQSHTIIPSVESGDTFSEYFKLM